MNFTLVFLTFLIIYLSFSNATEKTEQQKEEKKHPNPGGSTELPTDSPKLLPALKAAESHFGKAMTDVPKSFPLQSFSRFKVDQIVAATQLAVRGYRLFITFEVTRKICPFTCDKSKICVFRKYKCNTLIFEYMKTFTLEDLTCKPVDKKYRDDKEPIDDHLLGCIR